MITLTEQNEAGILVIWFFCAFCMDRTDQRFIRDEEKWEVYECECCHHENRVTVR